MSGFAVARTSRRHRKCTAQGSPDCTNWIALGERYVAASLPPNSDIGNTDWWHMTECSPCAIHYRHGDLLAPVPGSSDRTEGE